MALEMQQLQRLEQRMVLSPQMQQAIYLLQVPLQELSTIIQQEMVQNPLLEEAPTGSEAPQAESGEETGLAPDNGELEFREEFDRLAKLDADWKEYFRQNRSFRRYHGLDEDKRQFLENSITKSETLSEHLLKQLSTSALSEVEKEIGESIIGNIDENGYLAVSLEEIARADGAEPEEVGAVLSAIQTFHPLGVGARDLKECLLIQIDSLELSDPLAREIVNKFIQELGSKKYPQIARALKTTPERVQQAAEFIATLEPKPGRMFSPDNTQYIAPDIYLEKAGDDYQIIFNKDYMPHLHISNRYRDLMNAERTDAETKRYIKEKVKAGLWLIKNIQLRQETLYRITEEIVKRQGRFLKGGIQYLRPLKMSEVASAVGIHESTVSRAVANKYIQTPQGILQLKYFFTTALPTPSGSDISSRKVKQIITHLIRDEDPHHPLSDQKISAILFKKGIKLARRTLAKYRKGLNILPSHLRKKY